VNLWGKGKRQTRKKNQERAIEKENETGHKMLGGKLAFRNKRPPLNPGGGERVSGKKYKTGGI